MNLYVSSRKYCEQYLHCCRGTATTNLLLCNIVKVPVCELSGIPKEQLLRVANIYKPSANAMQSGTDNTHYWCIAFDTQERWENPLMGWTSR